MQLSVSGKQVDVGDALRGYVEERLIAAISKHFDRAIEAQVQFSREAHMIRTDISVHAGSGILLRGHATADDIWISSEFFMFFKSCLSTAESVFVYFVFYGFRIV